MHRFASPVAPVGAALLALALAACAETPSTIATPTTAEMAQPGVAVPGRDTAPRASAPSTASAYAPVAKVPAFARREGADANPSLGFINPPGVDGAAGYSQGVTVDTPARIVFIATQPPVDRVHNRLFRDLGWQTEQALVNIRAALMAVGADLGDVAKWNVYVREGQDLQPAYDAFLRNWGDRGAPPALSVIRVRELGRPEYLIQMDAIAAVPPR